MGMKIDMRILITMRIHQKGNLLMISITKLALVIIKTQIKAKDKVEVYMIGLRNSKTVAESNNIRLENNLPAWAIPNINNNQVQDFNLPRKVIHTSRTQVNSMTCIQENFSKIRFNLMIMR